MADYLPRSDNDFQSWVTNFVIYAGNHLAELGIDVVDLDPVANAYVDFTSKLADYKTAQQMEQTARQAKDNARNTLEKAVRQLVRRLQTFSKIDDLQRGELGIAVSDDALRTSP
ncbi:MAG: hypothetical protein JW709_09875 [Sedimentisphaerales bacterium]|nr:hypothetical protein [Sedimentisphaerales bacterium]